MSAESLCSIYHHINKINNVVHSHIFCMTPYIDNIASYVKDAATKFCNTWKNEHGFKSWIKKSTQCLYYTAKQILNKQGQNIWSLLLLQRLFVLWKTESFSSRGECIAKKQSLSLILTCKQIVAVMS